LNALVYDILAPEDYMQRPPMPPTFCFVLDISQAARRIGMVETVCEVVEGLVAQQAFPGLPRTQVAFILYGHEVHLIGFSETGPVQIFSLSRAMGEPFLPVPKDQLIVSVADNEGSIQQCMQVIRRMSAQSCVESSALRSALLYAKLVLESSGGKMLVFVGESNTEDAVQPTIEIGVNPSIPFYRDLAIGLTSCTITCDVFISATRYCSLYSIGELAKFTSGKVFFYPEMRSAQQQKLMNELWLDITRETVWETGLRVRVSLDWKMVQVYGHYHIRTSDLLSLPTLDTTQTVAYDLDLAVAVASSPYLYLQAALLFSTSDGDRRIRVINKRVLLTDQFQEIYKSADSQVVASVLAKRALFRLCELSRFEAGKGYLEEQLSEIYSVYEPIKDTINDPLQFLPSLTLGLIKLPLFNGLMSGCKSSKQTIWTLMGLAGSGT
jgi:protein transport protein SEC24